MAANPLTRCCTLGTLHEGEAEGEIKNISDISTYFTYPRDKSTEDAILIITDVMGHKFINVQLIADKFAEMGYFVVVPDMFHGDSVPLNRPEGFQIMEWSKNHQPVHVDPIINIVLKEMREILGCKRIGGVGYCFGGKYVCRYLKDGKFDAGFIAHPTMLTSEELASIERPLSVAAAGRDFVFTTQKRHESEDILDKLDPVPYQINLYSGVEHGFSVRCDLARPRQRYAKEQAFAQAVSWFDEFIKG